MRLGPSIRSSAMPVDFVRTGAIDMLDRMGRVWIHAIWNTYGTWLPGDQRGFRARHHKIHSSGTYKRPPPPGEHAGLLAYSRRSMGDSRPVLLTPLQRDRAAEAVLEKAVLLGIEIACLAVGATHVHALLALDSDDIEGEIGKLKRHSSHSLRDVLPGRVWSGGCDTRRVFDDKQFAAAFRYIADHRAEGAVVWRRVAGRPSQQRVSV